jgi:myo-inositol-1(or 4)-monophosphatase
MRGSGLEPTDALEVARAVAGDAAALLRGASDRVGTVRSKSSPRDLVTEWDLRVEDLIRERLTALAPGIPILGEERGGGDGEAELLWLVDPIDGTVNFAHGLPHFAVSIALERRGQPIAGVVAAPALGWHFYGSLGGGAFLDGRRLRVSRIEALADAMLATGFPYDRATNPDNNFAQWEHFQRVATCRRFGVASLDLAMVARGWLDGYWETRLHPWDLSAGALLVAEAGGRVTGIDGGPFVSARGHAVASNGAIHRCILDELAAVAASGPRPPCASETDT